MPLALAGLAAAWLCTTGFGASRHGPLSLKESDGKIEAENDFWKLAIDPAHGGAIRSFIDKKLEPARDWIYPGDGGLLMDMIWQQRHPGELQKEKYEYKIIEQTPEKAVIELWRSFAKEPYPGLQLRKILTLTAESPAINVETVLDNPTDKQVFPGLWIQNRMWPGGDPKSVPVAVRPSYMGIRMAYWDDARLTGSEFTRRPVAGWTLLFDRGSKAGMLWLTDFNYVQQFYNSLSNYTMETFFDRVLIKPGGKWSVKSTLLPLKDVENIFYADTQVFATGSSNGDEITFSFRPVDAPVSNATVTVIAEKSDKTEKLAEQTFELSDIRADAPANVTVRVPGSAQAPVVVTLKVGTPAGKKSLEFMHYADRTYYSMQDSAISFRTAIPKKSKPELMEERHVTLQKSDHLRVLHCIGLWADMNRINEALAEIDSRVEVKETFLKISPLGPELGWQPVLVDDLLGYDLVVMNNVGAETLGDAGEIAVENYVKAGGKLLICGGLYSLGNSRWNEGVLAGVAPVEVGGPFDMRQFKWFQPLKGRDASPAGLGAVDWYQQPKSVKPGADVRAEADGQPMLVSAGYGKGRVMVQLATPMGVPPKDVVPYWESPGWFDFLKKELSGLLGN